MMYLLAKTWLKSWKKFATILSEFVVYTHKASPVHVCFIKPWPAFYQWIKLHVLFHEVWLVSNEEHAAIDWWTSCVYCDPAVWLTELRCDIILPLELKPNQEKRIIPFHSGWSPETVNLPSGHPPSSILRGMSWLFKILFSLLKFS